MIDKPLKTPFTVERPETPVALLLRHLAMTGVETNEFLNARGVKCSMSAVKAWSRGSYSPPAPAFRELWNLALCLREDSRPVPPEAPAGFLALYEVCTGMSSWWEDNFVDEQTGDEIQ